MAQTGLLPHDEVSVLALDLDGVLHPGNTAVLVDFSRPLWQLALQLRTQGRFVWLPQLERALHGSAVRVLVHSTWRRALPDSAFQDLLGPEVGLRLISTDRWFSHEERRAMSHALYIEQALQVFEEEVGLKVRSLCVLDDRPEMFEGECWRLQQRFACEFVWVDGSRGLSDEAAWGRLVAWSQAQTALCPQQPDGVFEEESLSVLGRTP